MVLIILIFVLLICVVKIVSNNDMIKEHSKTPEDKANVKNAKRVFSNAIYANILIIAAAIITLLIVLCQFTTLDTILINYFSTDFYKDDFYNVNFYYIPAFIILTRKIIIEVKISEFLHKYFNVIEEEVNTKELIQNVLYKKKAPEENQTVDIAQNPEILNTEETKKDQA